MCFGVRALPEVRDQIRKHFFFINCYIITVLMFFLWSVLSKKKRRSKNRFSIVISKSDFGEGTLFCQNLFLKKPNTPEYAQLSVVMCPKLNFVTALLPPSPAKGGFHAETKILTAKKRSAYFCNACVESLSKLSKTLLIFYRKKNLTDSPFRDGLEATLLKPWSINIQTSNDRC